MDEVLMKLSEKINHLHHNIQELENIGQFDYNEAYEILEEVREALEFWSQ